MAHLSFLLPKRRPIHAVSGLDEALKASLTDFAAVCRNVVGGDNCSRRKAENLNERKNRLCARVTLLHNKESVNSFPPSYEACSSHQHKGLWVQTVNYSCSTISTQNFTTERDQISDGKAEARHSEQNSGGFEKKQIGENVPRRDKINFLVNTLLDLEDSKEAVYSALDAWVAWEKNFPIASLKRVLFILESKQQWHRIVQVIKWMLSKGQGTTMGTYTQLIQALEMDHRAEEAHKIWVDKLETDLHSVPWQLCRLMIALYHRNNMLENLVNLFKALEAYDRKPPEKSIVQRVADAYEMLGLLEDKKRVLEKYEYLFTETGTLKKTRKFYFKKNKKPGPRTNATT